MDDRRRRPAPLGVRGIVVLALVAAAGVAALHLGAHPGDLWPSQAGIAVAADLLRHALTPALGSPSGGGAPALATALESALETVLCAAAATGLAIVLGLGLGFFASTAWWSGDRAGGRSRLRALLQRTLLPGLWLGTRLSIAVMRSVHEVLWAILLLSALGANRLAAVVAIAIPYAGTFAKVFSEMVDEAPRDAAHALRGSGASDLQVYLFGLLPRALPDLVSYTFYRFECALRSAAVLGFFGFATLGLHIRQSFLASAHGELWTYLWVLIAMIVLCELWSGAVRERLVRGPRVPSAGGHTLAERWRARPRSWLLRGSLVALALLVAAAWATRAGDVADALSSQRRANLTRFLGEVRPFPLQDRPWEWGTAWEWAGGILADKGLDATLATLAIAVLAIVLAGLGGLLAALPAARTFASPEPFLPAGRRAGLVPRALWSTLVGVTRAAMVGLRAIPEYVWAFLLLAMLGPTAWPVVLALALHNLGILGRLCAETVENVERGPLAALRGLGARRLQIAAVGLVPAVLPRFLLYFFYRFETCVREATVLGMLGVLSLGYWIADARTRLFHDELLLLVLLGGALVVLADLVSALARSAVRRAL